MKTKIEEHMKNIRNIAVIMMVMILSSCSVSGPLTAPKALVTKNPIGSKVGIAEQTFILGLFYFGDGDLSIVKAAKKGNITKVATVDAEIVSGFFTTTYRTIVTGTNDEPEEETKTKKRSRRSRRSRK